MYIYIHIYWTCVQCAYLFMGMSVRALYVYVRAWPGRTWGSSFCSTTAPDRQERPFASTSISERAINILACSPSPPVLTQAQPITSQKTVRTCSLASTVLSTGSQFTFARSECTGVVGIACVLRSRQGCCGECMYWAGVWYRGHLAVSESFFVAASTSIVRWSSEECLPIP